MCEGQNELEIINILLENNKLIYTIDDLVGLTAYHARQIDKSTMVQNNLNMYNGEVEVIRIGDGLTDTLRIQCIVYYFLRFSSCDGLTDTLRIPKKYANKIISVKKYCTKPELEILLILSEGLYDNFQKVKSSKKPKDFAKENISIGRTKYKNQTKFYADYYGSNVDLLVEAIRKYKSLNKNKKDELYLCDLLA